jgi:hypothetical protein
MACFIFPPFVPGSEIRFYGFTPCLFYLHVVPSSPLTLLCSELYHRFPYLRCLRGGNGLRTRKWRGSSGFSGGGIFLAHWIVNLVILSVCKASSPSQVTQRLYTSLYIERIGNVSAQPYTILQSHVLQHATSTVNHDIVLSQSGKDRLGILPKTINAAISTWNSFIYRSTYYNQ